MTIGVGKCESPLVYTNKLKCTLPAVLPKAGNDYKKNPDNPDEKLPAVVVSILTWSTFLSSILYTLFFMLLS